MMAVWSRGSVRTRLRVRWGTLWRVAGVVLVLASVVGCRSSASAGASAVPGPTRSADVASHPWLAAILDADTRDSFDAQQCGGTLIAPEWILTAAHCVTEDRPGGHWREVRPSQIEILLGFATLGTQEANASRQRIADVVVYPSYNSDEVSHDLALVRLAVPVATPPARLVPANAPPAVGTQVQVFGWGEERGGALPATAHEADVVILDPTRCIDAGTDLHPSIELCAGAPGSAAGLSCFGDSGGPLVVGDVLVGVVSYGGDKCRTPNQPDVFASVAAYRDWIAQHTGLAA